MANKNTETFRFGAVVSELTGFNFMKKTINEGSYLNIHREILWNCFQHAWILTHVWDWIARPQIHTSMGSVAHIDDPDRFMEEPQVCTSGSGVRKS